VRGRHLLNGGKEQFLELTQGRKELRADRLKNLLIYGALSGIVRKSLPW
jgi:hypothetical protein